MYIYICIYIYRIHVYTYVYIHIQLHVTYTDVTWMGAVPPMFVHLLTFTLRDPRINGSLYKLLDFVMKQV